AKKNEDEEIKRCQDLAYTRDQLVDVFLDFLDPYEDFDSAEPCKQELNINIAVFLNSFIDRIETTNENEILITIKQSHELAYIRVHHLTHPRPQSIAVSSEIK
ncbi:2445_t:CDS:2, partial [Racocetra fulgida]